MKKILLLFLLCTTSPLSWATNTFVQENHSTSALTGATVSLAYSSNVTSAHLLATSLRWGTPTNAVNSVTGSGSCNGTWTVVGNTTFGSGVGGAWAYSFATSTGACTVSWNLAGSSPGEVIVIGEWSVPAGTILRAASSPHVYTTQTTLTSDPVASRPGNLMLGLFQILNGSTTTVSPGGSFNLRSSGTAGGSTFDAITDNLNATSGSQTATITVTGTQNGSAATIAVFGDPATDLTFPYPYSLPIHSGSSATNACTLNGSATSGNLIIVGSSWTGSSSTPSVTDNLSNSYSQKGYIASGSGTVGGLIYATTSGSSGTPTTTVSISGATFQQTYCYEFPPSFSLTVDGSADTQSFSGNPITIAGGNIATTRSGDVLISLAGGFHDASVCGPSVGYMALGMQRNNDGGCMETQITGAPDNYTGSFTNYNNMDQGVIVTVAFKANTMHISTPLAIPDGALSNAYDYTLGAAGAVSTVTWTGIPPAGLSLNSSTGRITGTPTISNNYSFSVSASDGTTTDTQTLTMKVTSSVPAITVVQSQVQTAVGTSSSLAFGSNVTIGNTGVIFVGDEVGTFFGAGPVICTDTRGTLYNRVSLSDVLAGGSALQLLIGTFPSSGANTVSCVGPSTDSAVGGVAELANVQNFGDTWNNINDNTASPISSASLSTLVPNSVVLCFAIGATGATTFTANSPFTGIGSGRNFIGAYDITTSVAGYSCPYTMSGNTDGRWGIHAIALRPGGGTVAPPSTGFPVIF